MNSYTVRVVEPDDLDNSIDYSYWDELIAWCFEQYGANQNRFSTTANSHYMEFTFTDSRDALLFALRWT